MSEQEDLAAVQVRMRKNGELIQRIDGQEIVVARYDRLTGHLEFETREYSVKLYQQVTAKIGTVNKGTEPSGLVIKTMGIKGEERTDAKKMPKRPKLGPLGDTAYEVAKYYLDNDPVQFGVRYGAYRDANGDFIRKPCRRVIDRMVDRRADADDSELPEIRSGKGSFTKTPVYTEREVIEVKNGIVARRQTAPGENGEPPLTFSPQEVIGGFQPDDDFEEVATAAGEDES